MESNEPGITEDDLYPETHYTDIPREFYSEATGEPFEHCSVCGRHLLKGNTMYMVEKAVKRYPKFKHEDVIFEYAICMPCNMQMHEKLSTESKQRIQEFMAQRANLQQRSMQLYKNKDFGLDAWLGKCAVTGQPQAELTEYQIMAPFSGNKLVYDMFPMMLSATALDEMVNLLSNHSLDVLNGFKDDITGMPPDLHELFKESRFVVM
jgi:hypothetical protein